MRVAITGSTGLIGSALIDALTKADSAAVGTQSNHEIVRLVRRRPTSSDEVQWDPIGGSVDVAGLVGVDAVVNLAGAGVDDRRWTAAYKRKIRESRVVGTRTIARAIARLDPRPQVLVSASAIGFYGDTGGERVDESSPAGDGFLAAVVRDWERAAGPAVEAGIRVVQPRSGLVVSRKGGAWGKLWPLFRLGLGGKVGSGDQYWSFVSLRDEVRALERMLTDDSMTGIYNVAAPYPATNLEITKTMGRLLHRPTIAAVPSFAIKAVLGDFSSELLGSVRVVPQRLSDAGFGFCDPTIEEALRAALAES